MQLLGNFFPFSLGLCCASWFNESAGIPLKATASWPSPGVRWPWSISARAASSRIRGANGAMFGANNGSLGFMHENLFDLSAESSDVIAQLRCTPVSSTGLRFGSAYDD